MKTIPNLNMIENGGVTSPTGFKASGICAGLKKSGNADMALIYSEVPATFAATFTSCLFAAAPVILCRERVLAQETMRAVIVNSGNANACTGREGYKNAVKMAELTAAALSIKPEDVLVSSTGRIGVQLPMDKISSGIAKAAAALDPEGGAVAARAIMTTDTRPKEVAVSFEIDGKTVTIGGTTKGAGMISPKMTVPHATMLCYVTTDADIEKSLLVSMLGDLVEKSFNRITVDGDMSTNDTVILMANGAAGVKISKDDSGFSTFKKALGFVLEHLARSIVLDGEGVTKFVTVEVNEAASEADALKCARAIANSLLCKTAWFGGDPNWGRVLAAAGYSGAQFNPSSVSLDYDDVPVVRNGMPTDTTEERLAAVIKQPEFTIRVNLGEASSSAVIWTNDISYEYVKINADYHT